MPRARLAAGKTATDSNEISQGPTELVGSNNVWGLGIGILIAAKAEYAKLK
jgi:hypothetical protein